MSVEPSGKKLTKREQKALKFRASKGSKGKGKKKDSDLTDLPENDLLDENAEVGDVQDVKEKKQRKRKRTEDDDGSAEGGKDEEAGEKGEGEQKPKKKRRKSKAAGNGEGVDQKHRLILFVGKWDPDLRAMFSISLVCNYVRQSTVRSDDGATQEALRIMRSVWTVSALNSRQ